MEQSGVQYENIEPGTGAEPKGKATMAMWFGIASLVGGVIPFINFLTPVFAILAIVFGIQSKKINGKGTAGIVMGSIYFGLFIIGIILVMFVLGTGVLTNMY